ncbi:uncharacterized protein ASCRUDRAFT_34495 [Ascoidea rubescens DSM 1968]|uniref:Amino acid transporter transmembrane domain-containing protein n=1 Tax=Ascoidea rubescens DSM 1968 TaxID=1344418 RepID=A0A1D2VHP9_9ASCO|nr:hypothetical protein ASCRUDRAFT_34495 [Ascoidea rubescens DSM 1968]ODV61023.1 hypothetical protein ASCRUDRAFT_34495 [Ascoidea rubescens DSM 1968]
MSASPRSSIISLTKTIVGAGGLALPYAFRADGVCLGLVIISLAAFASGFGLYLQVRTSSFVSAGNASFFSVASITFPKLRTLFDFAIALLCFGVGVSYLIIVGDAAQGLFADAISRNVLILSSSLVIVPLSFLKNLDSLKYSSVVGLVSIFYVFLFVIFNFVFNGIPNDMRGPVNLIKPLNIPSIISTFSILVFAFSGHPNMYSIINEAADKSVANLTFVIKSSIFISWAIFLLVGLTGYLTFGLNVEGNILLMYPQGISKQIATFLLLLMVILSFPLVFHPVRISVNNIYFSIKTKFLSQERLENNELTTLLQNNTHLTTQTDDAFPIEFKVPFSNLAYTTITLSLLILSYILALTVKSFAFVLSIVGATGGTIISFVLPGLFAYRLFVGDWFLKNAGFLLFVWGIIVMILCLSAALFLHTF